MTNKPIVHCTGCGCAGSEYGCCPDGLTKATGLEFEGCQTKPGEACNIKQEKGLNSIRISCKTSGSKSIQGQEKSVKNLYLIYCSHFLTTIL